MSKSFVSLTPLVYTIRVHNNQPDEESLIKPSYQCVATLIIVSGVATILAMHGCFNRQAYLDLKAQLQALQVTRVVWQRSKPDGYVYVERNL